jgi:hypothetical protein
LKMAPIDRMSEILEEHPDLSASGFRHEDLSESQFVEYRKNLVDEIGQVLRAAQLLQMAPVTKTCQVHSYALKHTLERWMTLREGQPAYLSNGAAILACYLLDIPVKLIHPPSRKRRTDPNAHVGINLQWYRGCGTVVDEWYNRKA